MSSLKPVTMEDLFTYRPLSALNLSPDGSRAAFLVTEADVTANGYKKDLYLQQGEVTRRLTHTGAVQDYIWENDVTVLLRTAAPASAGEAAAFSRLNVETGELTPAFVIPVKVTGMKKLGEGVYAVAAQCDANEPEYYRASPAERAAADKRRAEEADYHVMDELPFYLNGSGFTNKLRSRLFIYDEKEGSLRALTEPLFNTIAMALTPEHLVYAGEVFETRQTEKYEFRCYDLATGAVRQLAPGGRYYVKDMEAAGSHVMMVGSTFERYGVEENYCIYEIDPQSGDIRLVADADIYITNSLLCDCRFGATRSLRGTADALYFITTQACTAELYKVDPVSGVITKVVTRDGSVEDFDIANGQLVINGLYGSSLEELYRVNEADGSMAQLTDINTAALAGRYVAQPQYLPFTGHGIHLDGWVLLPKDYDPAKKYPAILDIHGGPRMVFGDTFYHEMQVWAGLGFFVFFCNPEGSSGCGNEFGDLRGKYGTIDYEDIMTFTDEVLAKYPQIDPKRVGVTGGSYGGFMTNWILGHTDRFAAAATQRSISNWISFVGVSDIGTRFGVDQQACTLYDIEQLWEHSPLQYSDRAVTPTLFIHSDEDYRCPMEQGLQMYSAMVNRGVPCRFVWFKGEHHGLSRCGKPTHRLRRLKEITDWLTKYTAEK